MERNLFLQTANEYLGKGFNPVYVHREHKYPVGATWKHLDKTRITDTELSTMADCVSDDDRNIGIITGRTSSIIVVDIDHDDGYVNLAREGIQLPDTLSVKTSRGRHHYYKYIPESPMKTAAGIIEHVDIRADGGLVVAPPSVHASGYSYEWENDLPIASLPSELLDFVAKHEQETKVNTTIGRGERIATMLSEGRRNATLTSIAGKMRMLGFDASTITMALKQENALSNNPLSDQEVEIIADSVSKYSYSETAYELNDLGNAHRFVDYVGNTVKWDEDSGKWLIFDGKIWTIENSKRIVMDKLQARIELIPTEIEPSSEEEEAIYEKYVKWAKQSKSKGKIDACLDLAKTYLSASQSQFDQNHSFFNTKSCCIDLHTGKKYQHKPTQMNQKISNAVYDSTEKCPRWEQFLMEIFEGDKSLIRWVQKAVGYSMSGDISEEVLFLLHGTGSNGKSKFLDVLQYVLGSYSNTANFTAFANKRSESANNDIASLAGARMVLASESNKGTRLNEALVKKLTGDKTMTARFLFKEYFTFDITFKIWLATNYLPSVYDDTNGIWRRLKIIPFNASFLGKKADRNLYDKLTAEASGILNWCVEGFNMWKKEGLGTCSAVELETQDYREEMDTMSMFLEEVCIFDESFRVKASDLFNVYKEWCKQNEEFVERKSDFKNGLERRGVTHKKIGNYYYIGIGIKNDESSKKDTKKTQSKQTATKEVVSPDF